MFFMASDFNQNLNSWNVSNVSTMDGMFENAENFNIENAVWYEMNTDM